jgi:hypothetical protein
VADSAFLQFRFGLADVRQFRVADSGPHDVTLVRSRGKVQDRVRHRDFRHVLGHVCKQKSARNIAAGVNMFGRAPAAPVEGDSCFIRWNAGAVELQPFRRK